MLVPLEAGWSDVGSWAAIWDIAAKDAAGNVGRGRVVRRRQRLPGPFPRAA